VFWLPLAFATSRPVSDAERCAHADAVVVAEVTGVEGRWADSGAIESWVDLAVTTRVRGDAPDTVTVRVLGGTAGGVRFTVSEAPSLAVDRRYLLFLVRRPDAWEVLGRDGVVPLGHDAPVPRVCPAP